MPVQNRAVKPRFRRALPWLAAVASGVLYALAFPRFDLFPLAFIFLLPLLAALDHTPLNAFSLFLVFGATAHLVLLYWMPRVMIRYGGMSVALSILAFLMVAAILSLVTAIAGWGMGRLWRAPRPWWFAVALLWVGKDLVLEEFMTGFPWCLVGTSQYRNLPFLQTAALGGVHFTGLLVILINLLFFRWWRHRDRRSGTLLILILVLTHGGGWLRMSRLESNLRNLPHHRAGVIQPNSHHDRVLSWREREIRLEELLAESGRLVKEGGAEFVVWPEYSVTLYPLQNTVYRDRMLRFSRQYAPLLAGFTDIQDKGIIKNAMVRFAAKGIQTYHKVHLTPFGEYIPFRRLFFFVPRIVNEITDFTPGDSLHSLTINDVPVATPICFEIVFPRLVRSLVTGGAQIIVTISNDSWFGDTSAPGQHMSAAVLRSVENQRYLLRSTSNGISVAVSPGGRIIRYSPYGKADRFVVPLHYLNARTPFMRGGWLFAHLCLILGLGALFICRQKRRG
ncbi:MAG TPA: apolipoprotein N-acyltransferase [Candidatus Aminicenantes bacterium]|nr:apolipoprotein N-acyltransferase [Candidatus Aminicenantes bacterium]